MICPRCKTEEIHEMRIEGVDFDLCSSCRGVWFDEDELAFMLELPTDIPNVEEAREQATPTDLDCPRCNTKLDEMKFASGNDLLIDRCAACHGIWLDFAELGEAEKIAARIGDPKSKIMLACKQIGEKGYQVIGIRTN